MWSPFSFVCKTIHLYELRPSYHSTHTRSRVYELCVGNQPTVGADLSRPPPIYRPVQAVSRQAREADKSAVGAIMQMNKLLRLAEQSATGR